MFGCLWSKSDLLDFDLGLGFPGFAIFFRFFVKEFPIIQYPTYRWIGVWGDLYQIQIGFLGCSESFIDGYNTFVFTVRVNETDLFNADFIVYPKV
jgi:hypothetical protein